MEDASPNAVPPDDVQERVARNDAIFRDANEGIRDYVDGTEFADLGAPYICECADPTCRELIRLTTAQYEHIRSSGRWFLNVPGHEASAQGAARVVERHGAYVIVEKIDLAGQRAEEMNPRSEE